MLITRSFRRAQPKTMAEWQTWLLRSNVGTVVAAALWGLTGWLFYGQGSPAQDTGLQDRKSVV